MQRHGRRRFHVLVLLALLLGVTALPRTGQAQQPAATPSDNSVYSDEFNDAGSLANWLPGPNQSYDLLDINSVNPGQLTFVPTSSPNNAWYADYTAPLIYKLVPGNFAATVAVVAGNRNSLDPRSAPPTGQYNSAGFLARDPASAPGSQNYVMYNVGFQANNLSTELKTTVNSTSILTLTTTNGAYQGLLRLCRVGNTFYAYHQLSNESDWIAREPVWHPTLPVTIQVGLIVNAWDTTANGSDLYALFDYIRFDSAAPQSESDCLQSAPPAARLYLPALRR